jgi:voltage-gated potassium channel
MTKIINPIYRVAWNVFITIITIVIGLAYPANLIFGFLSKSHLLLIELYLTIIYALDIFIWAFLNRLWHRERFLDSVKHLSEQSGFNFILDIISALPLYLLFNFKLLLLLRLFKLIKVAEMMQHLRQWAIRYTSHLTIVFFIFWLGLIAHWYSCGWLFLRGKEITNDNWSNYINSLYWCITTLTTVGYGDIIAKTNTQKLYSILVEISGVVVYGYLIGNVVNILSKKDPAKQQFNLNLEKLSSLTNFRKIPPELQNKIRDYYLYVWKKRLGFDEEDFLKGLPAGLQREVSLQLKKDLVEKFPLFQSMDKNFQFEIALRLKPVVAVPGEIIFKEGDSGNEMFFVVKGELSILKEGNDLLNILRDGDFFGEIALFKNIPRTATIRSETYCDLYSLDKENFDFVVKKYPDFASKMDVQTNLRNELFNFIENNLPDNPSDSDKK